MKRLSLLAALLAGCTPLEAGEMPSAYFPTAQTGMVAYGGAPLPAEKTGVFQSLGWPQNRADMIGTFGYPDYVSPTADIYQLVDGTQVWVFYQGDTATGYELRR